MTQDLAASAEPARVLVVEDDDAMAVLLGTLLRSAWSTGLLLIRAQRMRDATQELLDHGATVVLVDIDTETEDPLAAIEQLRSAGPETPVIALSDVSDTSLAAQAIAAGAEDHLVKSELTSAQLSRAIRFSVLRKRAESQLAHRALHDSLTGLPNRALFMDRLGVALDRARRSGGTVAVLFLDVDNFKVINDSFGHAAGDRLLAVLADRLRSMLRPMDTVARFGGDEFTLMFEDLGSEREVVLVAERISRAARVPVPLDGNDAQITVSIGIAVVDDPSVPPETVLREADTAMYRAKERGRSRYELFDEASRHRASRRLELETALRQALQRSELRLHYQPRYTLNGGQKLTGFEALVRWEHPERGLIAPSEFIPLAEETGIVIPIGEYVIEHALRQLSVWRVERPDLTISVNVSPRQLEDIGFAAMLGSAVRDAGLHPADLLLEIPERAIGIAPELVVRSVEALKAAGMQIAIDDYGTGAASLDVLGRMPLDALKIHQSFVGLVGNGNSATIAGAVIELAHALEMTAIAEGVETDEQLSGLQSLGCDAAQGFLLCQPLTGERADAIVAGD